MQLTSNASSIRDTGLTEIWVDEIGILWVKPKEGAEIDLEEVQRCFAIYRELGCAVNKKLQIFDARSDCSSTPAMRDYVARHGPEMFRASAIVTNNLAVRIAANFFIQFYPQRIPFKMFRDEIEAKEWLNQFR